MIYGHMGEACRSLMTHQLLTENRFFPGMRVLISMSISVLIWSLYPLAATVGLTKTGGYELLVASYIVATVCGAIITALYLYKHQLIIRAIEIFRDMNFRSPPTSR